MLSAATGNATLLSESHDYLTVHWQQEAQWASPAYYWPTHDNMAWPAAILLLGQLQHRQGDPAVAPMEAAMDTHHAALAQMFWGWMAGQVRPVHRVLPRLLQACQNQLA